MIEAFVGGLVSVLHVKPFLFMLIGCAVGFWVGILPGLGGGTTLALMIPFIYTMTPEEAIPFLLGMYSVCATTGDITSILFGIPGEPVSVALIMDGYALAKKGEAGRALGAALMSSLIGALIGAVSLTVGIPIVRPLVLAFGTPEMFMIIIIGVTCISSLSGQGKRGLLLGMMAGGFGFLCSLVGMDQHAGIQRFIFGQPYLWDGLPLIPVVVGIFAIPEIVDLIARKAAIAGEIPAGHLGKGVRDGIKDTFRHFWLTIRCSLIGVLVGMFPGIGGGVSQWFAYAQAAHSAKSSEEQAGFGKGDIRGVLGPGAANNAKEGGGLIPTVAFGIPTGPGMAILLGAFLLMGIVPGPEMLTKHLTLTFSMVWTIVVSNIIVVSICLIFINRIARLTGIRANLIVPFLLLLCFIGAFTANNQIGDLIVLLIFGGVGYLMMHFRWPRPPFVLGFVLGKLAEAYLYTSTGRYGAAWLLRPGVIVLFLVAAGVASYPSIKQGIYKRREKGTGPGGKGEEISLKGRWKMRYHTEALMSFCLMVISALVVITSLRWPLKAAIFPAVIGIPVFFMSLAALSLSFRETVHTAEKRSVPGVAHLQRQDESLPASQILPAFIWIAFFFLLILILGFPVAVPSFIFLYLKFHQERWGLSVGLAGAALVSFYGLFIWLLHTPFEEGWLQQVFNALVA